MSLKFKVKKFLLLCIDKMKNSNSDFAKAFLKGYNKGLDIPDIDYQNNNLVELEVQKAIYGGDIQKALLIQDESQKVLRNKRNKF